MNILKRALYYVDTYIVLPIADKAGKHEEFMQYMRDMYPEEYKNEIEHLKKKENEQNGRSNITE